METQSDDNTIASEVIAPKLNMITIPYNVRNELTFVETTPAGNKCGASNEILVCFGHTNWYDIRLKDDRFVESQQCQIVFKRAWVELWMRCNDLNAALLVQVRLFLFGQIVFAQAQQQIRWRHTETSQVRCQLEKSFARCAHTPSHLLVNAMGGRDCPIFIQQCSAAFMQIRRCSPLSQRNLPRPASERCLRAADDPRFRIHSLAAHCHHNQCGIY